MFSNSVANTKLVSNMTLILSFPPGSEPPCGVPGVPGIETETPASRVWGTPLDIEISGGFSIQWIGFVGELLTGNHGFFSHEDHEDHGAFRFQFSQQNQSIDPGGFHKWGYSNSWMVYFMENPSINGWFGGTPILGHLHIWIYRRLLGVQLGLVSWYSHGHNMS